MDQGEVALVVQSSGGSRAARYRTKQGVEQDAFCLCYQGLKRLALHLWHQHLGVGITKSLFRERNP